MKAAINQIIETVAEEFGVTQKAIEGRNKAEMLSLARQAAIYLSWRHLGLSDRTIASYFGKRKGDAVNWARKSVPALLETNRAFAAAYRNIEANLKL